MAKIIARELKLVTTGAAIVVDGKPVVVVSNESKAREVLEQLKKGYTGCEPEEKLISAEFEQKVQIKQKTVSADKMVSPDQALQILQTGTDSPTIYEVKEGDSLWLIARRHDTHVVDIVAANKLESEQLKPGQKLAISTTSPYIDVVTVVEGTREEKIPYKTRTEIDRKSSSVKVRQAGKEGQKQVTYRLTCKNGTMVDKNILSENIKEEAVDRVIVKGEKIVVASRGSGRSSGTLSWPVYGRITSGYGARGGSHKGIDIGAKNGTPIRAADGGTVRFAGWSGGYGQMVEIAHGNGVVTRYAHCSKLLVSKGSKVSKGQVIAYVGTTGRSTGPHLHFEVLNGEDIIIHWGILNNLYNLKIPERLRDFLSQQTSSSLGVLAALRYAVTGEISSAFASRSTRLRTLLVRLFGFFSVYLRFQFIFITRQGE